MGHIQQTFENDLTKDVRPFHFATGVTTLIHQLGAPLRQLGKRYPNAEIRVTVGVTEEMVAGLLERRFDLALISLPVSEANLKLIPLFEEELLIVRPSANKVGSGHISSMRASDKRLVESGFGYSILPEHALRGRSHFFQKFRIAGHRLTRSLALAMAQTECPRKLTESIASFLRTALVEG